MKNIPASLWVFLILLVSPLGLVRSAVASSALPVAIAGENLTTAQAQSIQISTDKTYAIIFLSTKCPCSLSHLTELKNLTKDYPAVQFIGVHSNSDEDVAKAETYFKVHDLSFPVIQDRDNALADQFGALKTPHAFVIANGKVAYRGGVSDHQTYAPDARKYLREALEDLKQKRTVKTATSRTLGCAIPRS